MLYTLFKKGVKKLRLTMLSLHFVSSEELEDEPDEIGTKKS